jgi:diadenosine tetraphosphate (Ap4A) HIT family hydrolase
MSTLIHRRVEQTRRGENPTAVCRVPSGWVVIGDVQFLRGYCLLLPDPVVPSLNDMDETSRLDFLRDMALLGDALLEVTGAARINYEILGNSEPALHAHVLPRYADEPEALRTGPAWFYDWKSGPPFDPERDRPLMEQIAAAVQRRLAARDGGE